MSVHLQRQIDRLKRMLLGLGAQVEENLIRVMSAVEKHDPALAAEVVAADRPIDDLEVSIEEECLHTLALHQPVAFDVRYVVAVLKIKTELERIGDLAANIAERAIERGRRATPHEAATISAIAERASLVVKLALDAIVDVDTATAREALVAQEDLASAADSLRRNLHKAVLDSPERVGVYLPWLSTAHYFEQIGTHASEIARHVIAMAEGHDAVPMPQPAPAAVPPSAIA
ncbi:MAG: phosphate signaling complex protein PhoU [Planctomycetota bacterium]